MPRPWIPRPEGTPPPGTPTSTSDANINRHYAAERRKAIVLQHAGAPEWTDEERAEYRRRYLAGEDVPMPLPEHDDGMPCPVCAALRGLIAEADAEDEAAAGR